MTAGFRLPLNLRDAGSTAWVPPADGELREHFSGEFLTAVPPGTIISTAAKAAPMLREGLAVIDEPGPLGVRARAGGLRLEAHAEGESPHWLGALLLYRVSQHVTDDRVSEPPVVTAGPVPAEAIAAARESVTELGLPGLVMAGADTTVADSGEAGNPAWSLALGWASLERPEPLGARHRFPAYLITALVTATALLRLVAGEHVDLDAPANRYLRTVRLADDEVRVRELLTHNQDAAAMLVLRPLSMTESFFPASWPERDAVTGYQLDSAGHFEPVPPQVCVVTAAGGRWSTAADLARFGAGWSSLLPADLAAEALRPQAQRGEGGAAMGLGWATHPDKDLAGIAGGGPGAGTSLLITPSTGRVSVTMANRFVPMEPVNARVLGRTA
jgi:CubicO group peptidase (beta-lactamase class C family)